MAPGNRPHPAVLLLFSFLFATRSQARQSRYPPPLYTGNFGDCLDGQSSLDIARFDLVYDAGNRTLAFHLDGTGNANTESVLLHISIDAYGTNRFSVTVDPCNLNITSLCPLTASTPVMAHAVLPADGHPIAELSAFPFNLPDYEGSAKLQVYAKSSNAEIACFQAAMTNGKTLSHPDVVAPVLGVFTLTAILASFLTAAYGVSIPHMRMHHAHSLSVLVLFETFQAIFFSGALSVNWPPILTAWWSNFAWSAGLIFVSGMVRSIGGFTGVGGDLEDLGNGVLPSRILGRDETSGSGVVGGGSPFNSSFLRDYTWSGSPVAPGLPLPGTWSGFPSTLSILNVPIVDAFMIGLIWLLIAVGLAMLAIAAFKFSLDGLVSAGRIKEDRLAYFRNHWVGYLGHAMMRILVISFFMIMTLTMLQFTIRLTVGPIAVATVLFILVLIGTVSLIASGCKTRTRDGRFSVAPDRIVFYRKKAFGIFPSLFATRDSTLIKGELEVQRVFGFPFFRIRHVNNDPDRLTVHLDEPFVKKFGWLTARYRRTRWWFLAYHVPYLFCRAAFLGGGWQSPRAQVYGVLVIDILNFAIAVALVPFEGIRNTAMGVWILGMCKILTTGISSTFLPGSNLDRSTTAALGVAIIVIQGLTVAALLILIVLGAISSWLSLMRNREEVDPDWMEPARVRYFTVMEKKARDTRLHSNEPEPEPEPEPPMPRFSVVSIQRRPKIEDEDEDAYAMRDLEHSLGDSAAAAAEEDQPAARGRDRHSRASSAGPRLSTGSLPRTARPYRASWSSRDFGDASLSRPESVLTQRLSGITCVVVTDYDASNASSTASIKRQSSMWSLSTPSVSRASSPSMGRSSREIVVSNGEGKRPPTALPEAPEPLE